MTKQYNHELRVVPGPVGVLTSDLRESHSRLQELAGQRPHQRTLGLRYDPACTLQARHWNAS